MQRSAPNERLLLDSCLDALDDIYDRRELAEVGAYRLFTATAEALRDTPWSAPLREAAAALAKFVYGELDPMVKNRLALEVTGDLRVRIAANNHSHEQDAVSPREALHLRLMAEYECFPTWTLDGKPTFNIDPAVLGLSVDLVAALDSWRSWFDSTFDRDDPLASKFRSSAEEAAFIELGRLLARRLAIEIGTGTVVSYKAAGSIDLDEYRA